MKYCVSVPLGRPLQFPNMCPFSGTPSPSGTVTLMNHSTSRVLPLPGGYVNSHAKTSLSIPASEKVARLAAVLQALIWVSLVGGIGIAFWLVLHHSYSHGPNRAPGVFLTGGLLLALGFRVGR